MEKGLFKKKWLYQLRTLFQARDQNLEGKKRAEEYSFVYFFRLFSSFSGCFDCNHAEVASPLFVCNINIEPAP